MPKRKKRIVNLLLARKAKREKGKEGCGEKEVVIPPIMTGHGHRHHLLQIEAGGMGEPLTPLNAATNSPNDFNCLVPFSLLEDLITAIPCSECDGPSSLSVVRNHTVPTLTRECFQCDAKATVFTPKKVTGIDGKVSGFTMDNLSCVFHSLMNGDGFAGCQKTCASFSLKGFCNTSFYNHASFLYRQMRALFVSKQREAIEAVRRYYQTLEGRDGNGLLDIDVSFDGTWMTKGPMSHVGIGIVVESNTGFVIDLEVISNFCQSCQGKEASLPPDELAKWKQQHHARCKKNFDGKSDAFDNEAAVRLWSRSTQLGLRYVTFLSDGDSSAFKAVCELNDCKGPYDVPVVKEDSTMAGKQVMRSIHSKIWLRCCQEKFVSMERVLFVAQGTVMDHNFGYVNGNLLLALGLQTTDFLTALKEKDSKLATPSRKPTKKRLATPSTSYGAQKF